jgi:hypothetical protein
VHIDAYDDTQMKQARLATVLVYLTTPLAGGHTVFPCAVPAVECSKDWLNGRQRACDAAKDATQLGYPVSRQVAAELSHWAIGICNGTVNGVRVTPEAGKATLFFNSEISRGTQLGEVDYRLWHTGCPVEEGQKITLQKWKRQHRPSNEQYYTHY